MLVEMCSRGCLDRNITFNAPALGHNWSDWEVTEEPTCCEEGEEKRVCERDNCEAYETRPIPELGDCNCGVIPGDLNGDGNVDDIDVMLLTLFVAGMLPAEAICLIAADVNGDGVIDDIDVMLLTLFVAGLLDSLAA
jgi:hypothetical protein